MCVAPLVLFGPICGRQIQPKCLIPLSSRVLVSYSASQVGQKSILLVSVVPAGLRDLLFFGAFLCLFTIEKLDCLPGIVCQTTHSWHNGWRFVAIPGVGPTHACQAGPSVSCSADA
jgi:hypothetical protein